MSKELSKRESKKPLTVRHAAAVAGVAIVGAIVAFWVLSSIVGIIFFFIKIIAVVALIGGAFWLVNRLRK